MSNKKLFADAIADAKTIRETALANARQALEETITPKLQSMLNQKLREINEEDNLDEAEDIDLEEVFGDEDETEVDVDAEVDMDADVDAGTDMETAEDVKVGDLSVEELTSIIRDVVSAEVGGSDDMAPEETDDMPVDDVDDGLEGDDALDTEDDEVNLDELLAELDTISEVDKPEVTEAVKTEEKELNEAIKTVKYLRKELNEVNLLNAKLIYVNKLFKSKNLNESQKVKVINAFDKATTIKEAKLVFESLQGSFKTAPKQAIKESLGFASKAMGGAPRKPIVEADAVMARWKTLANIK